MCALKDRNMHIHSFQQNYKVLWMHCCTDIKEWKNALHHSLPYQSLCIYHQYCTFILLLGSQWTVKKDQNAEILINSTHSSSCGNLRTMQHNHQLSSEIKVCYAKGDNIWSTVDVLIALCSSTTALLKRMCMCAHPQLDCGSNSTMAYRGALFFNSHCY